MVKGVSFGFGWAGVVAGEALTSTGSLPYSVQLAACQKTLMIIIFQLVRGFHHGCEAKRYLRFFQFWESTLTPLLQNWQSYFGLLEALWRTGSWLSGSGGVTAFPVRHKGATEVSTGTTLVDCLWDFSRQIADFTDEVLRLSKLHGNIRFVYGFE